MHLHATSIPLARLDDASDKSATFILRRYETYPILDLQKHQQITTNHCPLALECGDFVRLRLNSVASASIYTISILGNLSHCYDTEYLEPTPSKFMIIPGLW